MSIISTVNKLVVGIFPFLAVGSAISTLFEYMLDCDLPCLPFSDWWIVYCLFQSYRLKYCRYHHGMLWCVLASEMLWYLPICNVFLYNCLVLLFLLLSLLYLFKTLLIILSYDGTRKLFKDCRRDTRTSP